MTTINSSASLVRAGLLGSALLAAACGGEGKDGGPSGPEELPRMVELNAGSMQSGFAVGRLRKQVELDSYRISEHPTTRGEYESCVEAGACPVADSSECLGGVSSELGPYSLDSDDAPAVCVGHEAAAAYCKWLGGELPTLSQWLYAARGTQPQRYAWGKGAPSCEQHPLSQQQPSGAEPGTHRSRFPCASGQKQPRLRVLKHEAAASAHGLQDVLLTPGELLSTQEQAQFSACGAGFEACVVYGMDPGAIDAVAPLREISDLVGSDQTKRQGLTVAHAYSFRCVLEEE